MAEEFEELPLFPLHTVLFPYATLQLHVFEDRYREMVRHCLEFDKPIGVVLIRRGFEVGGPAETFMVGTAARLVQVHTYDDGRMDVQVRGERRFRVRRLDDSKPYLVGQVEAVIEDAWENDPSADDLTARARDTFRTLIEAVFARSEFNVRIVFPSDPTALSFVIADFLPLENPDKQRLLETTDTVERLHDLIPLLERQIVEGHPPAFTKLTASDLREWFNPN
jgi:Lon protease-like protein